MARRTEDASRASWVFGLIAMVLVAGLVVYSTYLAMHRDPLTPRKPVGWSEEWNCVAAGPKGGGFCVKARKVPETKSAR